jgi:hypothetical protein
MVSSTVVANALCHCDVNIFPYQGNDSGISGAVRFGISAQRPLVLTRDRQFNDLFDFEDEIYFSDSARPEDLATTAKKALEEGKVPERALRVFSWEQSAARYAGVYRSL